MRRETDDPRLPELFARGMRRPDGEVLNIFGTLAHHPDLLRRWLVFAAHVLSKNTLPARDRELLILRTGWNCKSRYEWGQHVLIARDCGLSDAEIERVKEGPAAAEWAAPDRSLLVAADELHATSSMSDPTWEALSAVYTAEQLLDIVATVGNYHLVAMFLNTTRVASIQACPTLSDSAAKRLAPPPSNRVLPLNDGFENQARCCGEQRGAARSRMRLHPWRRRRRSGAEWTMPENWQDLLQLAFRAVARARRRRACPPA